MIRILLADDHTLVRAELSVISQPRRGTTVRLRVPVPSATADAR